MNVKHIAATLAILGSASFAVTGCKKNAEGTEVPAEGEKKADGSCGANKDGSCGANKDGSCSAKKEGEGDVPAAGDAPAEATPPPAN
ncbi:hypothetical protein SAMN02745121_03344 [Nannocystis exedens]|uniref:Uncharacterized protein n=1 Tax=Nannocystis exedens TaxID=54 RepID=A0A1I1YJZ4_9BACT|nr:hypothetical protein [Nannocystis exedens]PCC70327.1 hypothetical protein NAEX_03370 [Nannocystis exedens]SFE19709.1 hypothetical protein SAMN02745121_03344 [Nannocystis exedens]